MPQERVIDQVRQIGDAIGSEVVEAIAIGIDNLCKRGERLSERLHSQSEFMYLASRNPAWRKRYRINPEILNPDGSVKSEAMEAFGASLKTRNPRD